MTPVQQLVRARVAPVLKDLGFRGRGSTFRYLRPGGHQAVLDLRTLPRGRWDLELGVGFGLLVQDWVEAIRWSSHRPHRLTPAEFAKADRGAGPVQGSVRDPEAQNPARDWWMDADDEVGSERLLRVVGAAAQNLVRLTDPSAFEAEVRADCPYLGHALMPTTPAVLVVLLASQGRFEEARELLPELGDWVRHDDFAAWVDFRANDG